MTDPISDMLTRIRNAQAVHKADVVLPYSKFKHELAKLLVAEGWLHSVDMLKREKAKGIFNELKIVLKYTKSKKSVIASVKRVSKPGRRMYSDHQNLPYVLNGLGMVIISTSKGLMTDKIARRQKIGGEIICEIY